MKTNEKIIAITAIVPILAAVMIVGCVEKDALAPINNTVFKNITAAVLDDIAYQLEDIETAKDNGDFASAKIELVAFDISVKKYIKEFEEMNVAENPRPCKKALISGFEEIRLLGDLLGVYLENPTVDEYVRYNMQAINATKQMEIVGMLAERL